RIQKFLLLDERTDCRTFFNAHYPPKERKGEDIELSSLSVPVVELRQASFRASDGTTLVKDADLCIKDGSCHIITGPAGSGKSSVFNAILGELYLTSGTAKFKRESVAYCAQTPWLRNVSVRENIVGGAEFGFDAEWYARVTSACALDRDFASVPHSDEMAVGSGGLSLSGGQKQRVSGDISLYKYYFKSVGLSLTAIFLLLTAAVAGLGRMPQVWLRLWTEHGTNRDTPLYFGVYLLFAGATVVLTMITLAFYFLAFIPASGKRLHALLLGAVLRAPLYFFRKVDTGVTLSRFSQDMTMVDQQLPMSFLAAVFLLFDVIIAAVVIVSGASLTAVVIPFVLAILYLVQKFYLRTSRQMRFLDLEAKSPLYTHFTETLTGAVTVRAFGRETTALDEHRRRLDLSQKPYYLMFCIQRWLNIVLDLIVAGMAVVLVSLALLLPSSSSSGAIGLAMVNLIGFSSSLGMLVSHWTDLETSLGAISRIRCFVSDTPSEQDDGEKVAVPDDWPSQGEVRLDGVVASYSGELEPALRNVSLVVKPGSKVAICGRTGSGKSSTILALLRLLSLQKGTMHIDNLNLSNIPLSILRTRLVCLPQDAISLPGSVRCNLLPFLTPETNLEPPSDTELISALTKTHIWHVISARGGLDAEFASMNLSPGQKQLFCLATAVLRKAKVVLLDEVTGSLDQETDVEVREVLQDELKGCTVLEVVHRIEVVQGYDVVVVMQDGEMIEVGSPRELLRREGGRFRELWDRRGGDETGAGT
ncbi:Multidrug resistance-associated protein 1, partial [Madurella mycetomatis]